MIERVKELIEAIHIKSLIVGVILGIIAAALLATGADDIDFEPLGGELVENELSVE